MTLEYLKRDIDISKLSNFKTRAKTRYYFEINNENDIWKLKDIVNFSLENNLKIVFVWWWTNLLFAFDIFDWIIIKNNLNWYSYNTDTKILEVFSNEKIRDISELLEKDYNQNIFHRFIWLPWTFWWAVFWNAWCFWLEIENNFLKAEVYNLQTNKIEIIDKQNANFSYRNSLFKESQKYFIIKIFFDLSKIEEKYSSDTDNIKFREEVQPKWNSAWSFFKNPSKQNSAWSLIEKVWLRWYKLRSAYFSYKHANFLMSRDFWDYKDLLSLIELAQKKVKQEFDIDLIPEARIIFN